MTERAGRQLAFDLPIRKAQGIDDFLITPASRNAAVLVEDWRSWPGHCAILIGPAGSGKSHLTEIWRQATGGRIIPIEAVWLDNVDALVDRTAIAIEDLPGPKVDEKALFHLLNLARERQARVLLTSRSYPQSWGIRLRDLASRLRAAITVEIGPPDDELLRGLLVKLFADRQIAIDETIVAYLVSRMPRSFEAARKLVTEIDRRALEEKAEISRSFVARVFGEVSPPEVLKDD